jgi:hypothetical protein
MSFYNFYQTRIESLNKANKNGIFGGNPSSKQSQLSYHQLHFGNDLLCSVYYLYKSAYLFSSLSFSFKFCVQLCDDVCGVQVVNYSMDCAFKMNCIILNPNG